MPPKNKKSNKTEKAAKIDKDEKADDFDIDKELEKINAEEIEKEKKMEKKKEESKVDSEVTDQTIEIYNNLLVYYNSTAESGAKCIIEPSKRPDRVKRYYKTIHGDEKLKNYLLKRNKLLFYKNKDTEILPKINLYAVLKSEDKDDVIEKLWDNLILIYLSCEENSKTKDENMFENLKKNMATESGTFDKMFENVEEEVKKMDIGSMFEKLKFNTTPESKKKTKDMLSEMISKLTDNMAEISKAENPQEALMTNLHKMAADYSKLFESGEFDFMSFLSTVPEILKNPKELTKNIDLSKLQGLKLPDFNDIMNSTQNVGEDVLGGSEAGKKAGDAFKNMMSGGGGKNPMADILKGMMAGSKNGKNPMADLMKGMMSGANAGGGSGADGKNPMAEIMKGMMSGGSGGDGANPMAEIMKGMMSGDKDGANPMAEIMKGMMNGAGSGGDGANPMADILKGMMGGGGGAGGGGEGANPMADILKGMMGGGGGEGGGGGGALGALGALGGLGGLGALSSGASGITESLNKMTGGNLDNILASVIENTGSSMLEKMAEEADKNKNKKPLTEEQIKELEEFLENQKLD
jgi:hypothetical protein